jgi:ubiquinone/menaquinone biosynthesis C-methylase UbiE
MPDPDATAATQAFYGRWAALYDRIARLPGVRGWRERAVDALALDPGDTVVEMGCGTGANVPHLRERVGSEGTVVGVDLTRGMLATARADRERAGWANVHLLQGDATAPPVAGPVDAVLATFVVGMLPDPAAAVGDWFDLLRPGGRVALLDAAPTEAPCARPLNLPFAAFVWAGAPGKRRGVRRPSRELLDRVETARRAVAEQGDAVETDRFGLGFLRVTSGVRPDGGPVD